MTGESNPYENRFTSRLCFSSLVFASLNNTKLWYSPFYHVALRESNSYKNHCASHPNYSSLCLTLLYQTFLYSSVPDLIAPYKGIEPLLVPNREFIFTILLYSSLRCSSLLHSCLRLLLAQESNLCLFQTRRSSLLLSSNRTFQNFALI